MNSILLRQAEANNEALQRPSSLVMATCPVCGIQNTRKLGPYRYVHPIFSGCSRVECNDCKMVFTAPMPTDPDLSKYNANYFATAHGGKPNSQISEAFFEGIALLRLDYLRRFLDKNRINVERVLELGPGPGYLARNWLAQSPLSHYSAVETDGSCHELLLSMGVNLVGSPQGVSCDLVVMSHVLEHVADPVGFVRAGTQSLRRGGALFIEVPCRDWEHKPIDEPHVLFFDKASMQRLLDDLGFTDIEIAYYGQTIAQLKTPSKLRAIWARIRTKLISWGMVAPFAGSFNGLDALANPLQRAMVGPYGAHLESEEPAWWLRAVARKR
jgi:hypothetical protein